MARCFPNLDRYRLPFTLAAPREPFAQRRGKPLQLDAEAGFEDAIRNRKRIVEFGRPGEVPHGELVEPSERAGAAFTVRHNVDLEPARVQKIPLEDSLALRL
jgi:hypothetical protein